VRFHNKFQRIGRNVIRKWIALEEDIKGVSVENAIDLPTIRFKPCKFVLKTKHMGNIRATFGFGAIGDHFDLEVLNKK
jgi:hypothetical protein